MKIGLRQGKQRNVAGLTAGPELAAREWQGQKAVYDQVQRTFAGLAEDFSRREQRKGMLKYQETVSKANQLIASGDELSLADIEDVVDPTLLPEEARNYALANEGRVPTWMVQGPLLKAVMDKATEDASAGVSIPAHRDAFKDQLREQNIRVLQASMADMARKQEVWEKKEAIEELTLIRDPYVKQAWLEKDTILDPDYKAVQIVENAQNIVRYETNGVVEYGTVEEMRQEAAWYMSDEGREAHPHATEDTLRIAATRLRSAADARESEAAATGMKPDNVAKINFSLWEHTTKQLVDGFSVTAGEMGNWPTDGGQELAIAKRNLEVLEQHSEELRKADPDTPVWATQQNTIDALRINIETAEAKYSINGMPTAEAMEHISSLNLPATKKGELITHLRERNEDPVLSAAVSAGVIASEEDAATFNGQNKLRQFYNRYDVPHMPERQLDWNISVLQDVRAHGTPEWVAAGMSTWSDPYAMEKLKKKDATLFNQLRAMRATEDPKVAEAILMGATSGVELEDSVASRAEQKIQDDYAYAYMMNGASDMTRDLELAVKALLRVDPNQDVSAALAQVAPVIDRYNGGQVILANGVDPLSFRRFMHNINPEWLKEFSIDGELPANYSNWEVLGDYIKTRGQLRLWDGGYVITEPGSMNAMVLKKDKTPFVLPITSERLDQFVNHGLFDRLPTEETYIPIDYSATVVN